MKIAMQAYYITVNFNTFSYEKQGFFSFPQGKNIRKNCPNFSQKNACFCAFLIDKKMVVQYDKYNGYTNDIRIYERR